MNEEWRPIIGYLDYFISNQGNVKSLKGKQPRLLKQKTDSDGYKRVALSNGTGKLKHFGVHRLVAIHFIENTDGKPVVNHLDGDKSNNDFTNLEWATISENGKHAYSIGLTKRTKKMQEVSRNNMLKFNESCRKSVLKLDKYTGEILAEYASIVEATNAVGLKSKGDISKCCKGKTKTAGGFKWKYKEVVS